MVSWSPKRIVPALLALAALAACGAFGSDDEATGPGPDAGSSEGGSAPGEVGEVGQAPCDPGEAPPAGAVYVSPTGGATADGTASAPFGAIGGTALAYARSIDARVLVLDEGTYPEAVVLDALPKGLVVDGAWQRTGGSWTRDCGADRRKKTVLQSDQDVGVRVVGDVVPIVLSNLTVVTRPASGGGAADADGASRYGVFVERGTVRLEGVAILAEAGDPGGVATAGAPGAPLCATSTTACVPSPTAGGDAPNAAAAAASGTFGPSGYVPVAGAAGAAAGTPGQNGTPGATGATLSGCQNTCGIVGGQQQCVSTTGSVKAADGACGCGGSGGKPGAAGRGGGASVGLFVASGLVTLRNSEIAAARGGDGSTGGAGGAGGQPTAGAPGAPADCYEQKCCTTGTCPSCGCYAKSNWNALCSGPAPTKSTAAGGDAGGSGTPGGKGASGGGGAGGPSFAYVALQGAQVIIDKSRRAYGAGGAGAGGAPGGVSGEKP